VEDYDKIKIDRYDEVKLAGGPPKAAAVEEEEQEEENHVQEIVTSTSGKKISIAFLVGSVLIFILVAFLFALFSQ